MSRRQCNLPLKQIPNQLLGKGCKECGKPLTTPVTAKRGICRSCWRVAKVLVAAHHARPQERHADLGLIDDDHTPDMRRADS
jgi:hypothetical protein